MKKLILLVLLSVCLFGRLFAQVNVQWQSTTGSGLIINGSAIYGAGNANSVQKLQVCENGAIEFTTQMPRTGGGAGSSYRIGFASASNPSSMLYGLYMDYMAGSGYALAKGNCIGTPLNCGLYTCDLTGGSGSTCPNFADGDKFKIERVNNVINFWHISSTIPPSDIANYPSPNCTLLFSASAINSTPTDEWVVFFAATSTGSAVTNCTVTLSVERMICGPVSTVRLSGP